MVEHVRTEIRPSALSGPAASRSAHLNSGHRHTLLIAHPSADVYGSDLQMLQTVSAMRERDWDVVVVMPGTGELVPHLTRIGAQVRFLSFPVLRRADASPHGIVSLGAAAARALPRMRKLVREVVPDVVYVNTITVPWWLLVARSAGVPAVCHVHEAEPLDRPAIRIGLNSPLLTANSLIAISPSAMHSVTRDFSSLKKRTHLIYNGVPEPSARVTALPIDETPVHLLVAGRLSPRKAPHVALEATAILRRAGHDMRLEVCGTAFDGYEWYEDELRARAAEPDLEGAVTFSGYLSPLWTALTRSHIVLAPSLREPFGNVVVEAQFSRRPVVAAAAMGHLETVINERTGLLVEPGSADEMAAAVTRLIDDPDLVTSITDVAATRAQEKFSVARYGEDVAQLIKTLRRSRSGVPDDWKY